MSVLPFTRGLAKTTAHFLIELYMQGNSRFTLQSIDKDGEGGLKWRGCITVPFLLGAECRTSIHIPQGALEHFKKNPEMSIKEYYASRDRNLILSNHVIKHITFTLANTDKKDFYLLEDTELITGLKSLQSCAFKEVSFKKRLWNRIELDTFGAGNVYLHRGLELI